MTDTVPDDLIEALRSGTCVAYVGAGFSIPAGLPTNERFLRKIAMESDIPWDPTWDEMSASGVSYDVMDTFLLYTIIRL